MAHEEAASTRSRTGSRAGGGSAKAPVGAAKGRGTAGRGTAGRGASGRGSKGGGRESAARRVADARRSDRERRQRRQRLVAYMRIALVVAVIGGVIGGAVTIYRSDVFSIERIDVVGNSRVGRDEVLSIAAVPADATLLRFPGEAVGERLEADPRIGSATVSRDFPDAMRIRIEEREPVAYVDVGTNTLWVVDSRAFVVATETPEATSTLPVVRDVPSFEATAGAVSDSAELVNALGVLDGLSDALRQRVRAVSAPSVDKTTLITVDGIEVLVGSADDIARKDLIARRILDEQKGKVVYVNVRSVDRPTWRGVDE